jgi:ferredoxin/flavodoxin---NADP+ reductase
MEQVLTAIQKKVSTVIEIRNLTESSYVLKFERMGLEFKPGQYIVVGLPGSREKREYSIYSSAIAPFLEILIKEVDHGDVSKKLKRLKPGDPIEIEGPFGYFVLEGHKISNNDYLFIASGTGISPFHSFVTSYPQLQYKLLHGIRILDEAYEKQDYEKSQQVLCTSRENTGNFHGRVTDYLKKYPVNPQTLCYLCGNSEMVDDAYKILESQGVPPAHLHAEIYF